MKQKKQVKEQAGFSVSRSYCFPLHPARGVIRRIFLPLPQKKREMQKNTQNFQFYNIPFFVLPSPTVLHSFIFIASLRIMHLGQMNYDYDTNKMEVLLNSHV